MNIPNLTVKENEDLSRHSTMRVGGIAKYFIEIHSEEDLKNFVNFYKNNKAEKLVIIGEGSNTLFTGDVDGIVLKIMHKGIEIIEENDEHTTIKVMGGENWHSFVEYCVNKNLSGNENLAFIPGTVGAAPVQNIAAYGQVQEDTFLKLDAFNLETGEIEEFNEPECEFKYRSSIFKAEKAGKYIINSVTYELKKVSEYIPDSTYHSRYESLSGVLEEIAEKPYTLKDIFNAVIEIRTRKLPLVRDLGTLGSFFMNPFVNKEQLKKLQERWPDIQYYPVDKMQYPGLDDPNLKDQEIVKIPAGWLLEELGWRGKMEGNVGTYKNHSLIVITDGPATGSQVLEFMSKMKKNVLEETGVELNSEINVV